MEESSMNTRNEQGGAAARSFDTGLPPEDVVIGRWLAAHGDEPAEAGARDLLAGLQKVLAMSGPGRAAAAEELLPAADDPWNAESAAAPWVAARLLTECLGLARNDPEVRADLGQASRRGFPPACDTLYRLCAVGGEEMRDMAEGTLAQGVKAGSPLCLVTLGRALAARSGFAGDDLVTAMLDRLGEHAAAGSWPCLETALRACAAVRPSAGHADRAARLTALLAEAAAGNLPAAQRELGLVLREGWLLAPDPEKAKALLEKAWQAGDSQAGCALAESLLHDGPGSAEKRAAALAMLRAIVRGADDGSGDGSTGACALLGAELCAPAEGAPSEQDLAEGLPLLERVAATPLRGRAVEACARLFARAPHLKSKAGERLLAACEKAGSGEAAVLRAKLGLLNPHADDEERFDIVYDLQPDDTGETAGMGPASSFMAEIHVFGLLGTGRGSVLGSGSLREAWQRHGPERPVRPGRPGPFVHLAAQACSGRPEGGRRRPALAWRAARAHGRTCPAAALRHLHADAGSRAEGARAGPGRRCPLRKGSGRLAGRGRGRDGQADGGRLQGGPGPA